MDDDLRRRLEQASMGLHDRARELSHPGKGDEDTARIMSALALTMEAVRVLGAEIKALRSMQHMPR